MSNAKLKTHSEIERLVEIKYFGVGKSSIEIGYLYDGKEKTLVGDVERAASLLKTIGAIDDYCGSGDDVTIETEMDYYGYDRVVQIHWLEFVRSWDMSMMEAIRIVAHVEDELQTEAVMADLLSIPGIIKSIGGERA